MLLRVKKDERVIVGDAVLESGGPFRSADIPSVIESFNSGDHGRFWGDITWEA